MRRSQAALVVVLLVTACRQGGKDEQGHATHGDRRDDAPPVRGSDGHDYGCRGRRTVWRLRDIENALGRSARVRHDHPPNAATRDHEGRVDRVGDPELFRPDEGERECTEGRNRHDVEPDGVTTATLLVSGWAPPRPSI